MARRERMAGIPRPGHARTRAGVSASSHGLDALFAQRVEMDVELVFRPIELAAQLHRLRQSACLKVAIDRSPRATAKFGAQVF